MTDTIENVAATVTKLAQSINLDAKVKGDRFDMLGDELTAIASRLTALSARASAGEGGEWTEKARQMIAELRDYVVNERDAQVLPRKAASYQRELDDIDALLAAAPQPAQAGASGGGEPSKVEHDAALAQALREACAAYEAQGKDIEHCDVCIGVLLDRTREILRTTPASPATGEDNHG